MFKGKKIRQFDLIGNTAFIEYMIALSYEAEPLPSLGLGEISLPRSAESDDSLLEANIP